MITVEEAVWLYDRCRYEDGLVLYHVYSINVITIIIFILYSIYPRFPKQLTYKL